MTEIDSVSTVLALLLAALGLLAVPERTRSPAVSGRSPRQLMPARPIRRAVAVASTAGLALLSLAPTWWWLILPAAGLLGGLLARGSRGRSPAKRATDRRLVAVYLELLASCLDAGMAVAPALRAVLAVLAGSGPPGGRTGSGPGHIGSPGAEGFGPLGILDAVAAMLLLGADPRTAWRIADPDELLAPLAAAARRSAAGGGGLADAVREHAAQLRQETAAASVRSAGRAGVLMTAPLGVCFLPAFLCLGLAPVVVGLLGQLNIF
jgi:hypothetical protein